MRQYTWLIFVITFIFYISLSAQITFERTYGGSGDEYGFSVQITQDGGYVIAGKTRSFGAGNYDYWLVKTDSFGDTLWTKTYGGTGYDICRSVQQTRDGGYILAGYTVSFGAGDRDFYVVKTDSLGDTLWTRTYGGSERENCYSARQTADGGYIIIGSTTSFGAGGEDVYLVKTDSIGNPLWIKTYGGPLDELGVAVLQTDDGGYIFSGRTGSGPGNSNIFIVKTDADGNTIWSRTYGWPNYYASGLDIQKLPDGYVVAGPVGPFQAYDAFLMKLDTLGDSLWFRTYDCGGEDWAWSVKPTLDGGFILAGRTRPPGSPVYDVLLIKTNALGYMMWMKTYGGTDWDSGESVQQTSDSGYIVAGATYSYGAGSGDFYLIKTDPFGNVVGVKEIELQYNTVPFQIQIFDVSGRLVRHFSLLSFNSLVTAIVWGGRDNSGKRVNSGVYFLRIVGGNYQKTKKFLLLR